jgi:hypothetical protein
MNVTLHYYGGKEPRTISDVVKVDESGEHTVIHHVSMRDIVTTTVFNVERMEVDGDDQEVRLKRAFVNVPA